MSPFPPEAPLNKTLSDLLMRSSQHIVGYTQGITAIGHCKLIAMAGVTIIAIASLSLSNYLN